MTETDHERTKSGERIAKVIARAGLASRREAEAWIEAGRVAVNGGTIRSPALDVAASDRITVDGVALPARERTRLFLYHKPRGLMTTHADPQGRPTIFQKLPPGLPRLISVGRLDFNTEGLLLLTNDGALARVLELPATGWLRRYRVRAHGAVTQRALDGLRKGVTISGIRYGVIEAALERTQGSNLWLSFAIREGKNREVRTVLGHLELTVTRLIRISFGPFQLGELETGAVEEIKTRVLREQIGDKLAADSNADFSGPIAVPPPARRRDENVEKKQLKPANEKTKGRKSSDHAWRAPESERPTKLLRRTYHGKHRDIEKGSHPSGEKQAGLLKDRKGRPVLVERYGQPPINEVPRPYRPKAGRPGDKRGQSGRRRVPDRASGARPKQPRNRR